MRCKLIDATDLEMNANETSGGGNGMSAFPSAVHFDVPVVDGDAMGRAYPTMYHGKSFISQITDDVANVLKLHLVSTATL